MIPGGEQVDSECVNKLVYKTPLTYFTNGEAMKLELSAMYSASWGERVSDPHKPLLCNKR